MAKYKFSEVIWNSDIWFIWHDKVSLASIIKIRLNEPEFNLWAKYNEILTYITLMRK